MPPLAATPPPRPVGSAHPRRRRARSLTAIAALALLCAAPGALAAPDQEAEPNDNLLQINGPISPEGVTGTINTASDADLFIVRLRPQRQVRLRFEITNGNVCTNSVSYDLSHPNGAEIASSATNTTRDHIVTTPGVFGGPAQALYLSFGPSQFSVNCSYRFTVTDPAGGPTDAIDNTPLPAATVAGTAEPNDLASQAVGPLAGEVFYEGAIETENDIDYLLSRLAPGANATVELTAVGGRVFASIERPGGDGVEDVSASANEVQTTTFTVTGEPEHLIRLSGDLGARWRLRILPLAAIAPPPPPPRPIVAAVRPQLASTSVRGRKLVTRVRVAAAGRLQLVLVGKGRRIGLANVRVAGPRTLSISYRRPLRVPRGAYRLEVRFRVSGGPVAIVRRIVRLR